MSAPQTPPTVGEIVEALLKQDQSLPLVVSTHYDNDVGHSSSVGLSVELIYPAGEGSFWNLQDISSPTPGSIRAVVLTGATF
jgi:hypothetical protein